MDLTPSRPNPSANFIPRMFTMSCRTGIMGSFSRRDSRQSKAVEWPPRISQATNGFLKKYGPGWSSIRTLFSMVSLRQPEEMESKAVSIYWEAGVLGVELGPGVWDFVVVGPLCVITGWKKGRDNVCDCYSFLAEWEQSKASCQAQQQPPAVHNPSISTVNLWNHTSKYTNSHTSKYTNSQ